MEALVVLVIIIHAVAAIRLFSWALKYGMGFDGAGRLGVSSLLLGAIPIGIFGWRHFHHQTVSARIVGLVIAFAFELLFLGISVAALFSK